MSSREPKKGAQKREGMQSITTTNVLLLVIAVLILLGSPLGPGGCHSAVGRYQVVSLPPPDEVPGRPPTLGLLDTATGSFEPLETQPTK